MSRSPDFNGAQLGEEIKNEAARLGFDLCGITDVDLGSAGQRLEKWLDAGYQGEMAWMSAHGPKRYTPELLVVGTMSCISVAIDYLPEPMAEMTEQLNRPGAAYISRYALGRDYHKLLRNRLKRLAAYIEGRAGPFGYRVFTDSAPVMEKPLAEKAGLGWIGKHSNLINKKRGSWFFLGEIYTDLPLPADAPTSSHCGDCRACVDACPTGAIVDDHIVDARLCISYLTIELKGEIPEHLRRAMGNRIFGCDDCQLCCPWNRFAQSTREADFTPRHRLNQATLVELFNWSAGDFDQRTLGSAIRRTGYENWLRNIAVALGNALADGPTEDTDRSAIIEALNTRRDHPSAIVRSHVNWALGQGRENS